MISHANHSKENPARKDDDVCSRCQNNLTRACARAHHVPQTANLDGNEGPPQVGRVQVRLVRRSAHLEVSCLLDLSGIWNKIRFHNSSLSLSFFLFIIFSVRCHSYYNLLDF